MEGSGFKVCFLILLWRHCFALNTALLMLLPCALTRLLKPRPLLPAGGSLADLFLGEGFIMAREKNSPGLVLQKHCSAVQLMDRDERQRVLALQQVLQGPAPLAHFVQDLEVRVTPWDNVPVHQPPGQTCLFAAHCAVWYLCAQCWQPAIASDQACQSQAQSMGPWHPAGRARPW